MKKPIRELKRRIFSRCFFDTHPRADKAILLAGAGRSGTTWLADVINHRNQFRFLFEPFHRRVMTSFGLPECLDVYRRVESESAVLSSYVERVLEGRIRNMFVDAQNRKFVSGRRLIKDVSCNFNLHWICARFPDLPVVLLIRHPLTTALSRMGMGWKDNLGFFAAQSVLCEEIAHPFMDLFRTARDPLERHVLECCLETFVPLRQLKPRQVLISFYEHCIRSPESELGRIFSYLNLPFESRILGFMQSRSMTSRKTPSAGSGANQPKWPAPERMSEILSAFGLARYFDESGGLAAGFSGVLDQDSRRA